MLDDIRPFLSCEINVSRKLIPISWKAKKLDAFEKTNRRINPQLAWVEWLDTRKLPKNWKFLYFDDANWVTPIAVDAKIGELKKVSINNVKQFEIVPKLIAKGEFIERYGYEKDQPGVRFISRQFNNTELPSQGVWRRYDLGRVRLGRSKFILDLPEGTVVEVAYSESLVNDRVTPFITLSAGESLNLEHFVSKGGKQTLFSITPKGGRYMEIHVLANPKDVKFIDEKYIERGYHGKPEGNFVSNDELLNKIWYTGIETYRACTEDALVDNVTRERGQWTGDAVSVGLDIVSVGYTDLALIKRSLYQSAQSARNDGLIAGLCPGGEAYLSTYALQWISAVVHYYKLTGDKEFLKEMYSYAKNNLKAFEPFVTENGLKDGLAWQFVDWGYFRNEGPIDIAYNLHYYEALKDMTMWSNILNNYSDVELYKSKTEIERNKISIYFKNEFKNKNAWQRIGYHSSALALKSNVFNGKRKKEAIDAIKKHILNSFPNKYDAPRLSDPGMNNKQLITPYFAHFAYPTLIENGEIDFVINQYRTAWGWALQNDRTTWVEVFDTRWSMAHQWAGAPTWQLSRYVLGLHPRNDIGENHFELKLFTGDLKNASGEVPIALSNGKTIKVEWKKVNDKIEYKLKTPEEIYLHFKGNVFKVNRQYHTQLNVK